MTTSVQFVSLAKKSLFPCGFLWGAHEENKDSERNHIIY